MIRIAKTNKIKLTTPIAVEYVWQISFIVVGNVM